ncbi:MAG: MFS transporter [Candidatus Polarisedimenticolia bacterium]
MSTPPVSDDRNRADAPAAIPEVARELGGLGPAIALILTMFVEAVGYGVVAPTLPFLARRFGAGEGGIGLLIGLYAAVGLVAVIPLGILANRHGRRMLVYVGLVCLTAASIGFVLAPTYGWLVIARLAQGLGAASVWVGALTMAADLSPDRAMGKSLAWISGSWSLGFVVGPALGGLGTERTPFIVYAALSGAALAAALLFLPETGRPGSRATLAGIVRVLRRPTVLLSGAATFVLSYFYGALEAFLPLLADERHVSRLQIGLLFAIAGAPSILFPRLTGALADRYGDLRVLSAGLLYAAVLGSALTPLTGHAPLWVAFALIGLVEVIVYVPAVALLNRGMSREDRIFATGSHSYAFSAGFFLGPAIGGLLLPLGGWTLLFGSLAAVAFGGVVCLLATRGRIAETA